MYQTLKTEYDLAELSYLQGPLVTPPPEGLEIVLCQVLVIVGCHMAAMLGIVEHQFKNTFTFAYAACLKHLVGLIKT